MRVGHGYFSAGVSIQGIHVVGEGQMACGVHYSLHRPVFYYYVCCQLSSYQKPNLKACQFLFEEDYITGYTFHYVALMCLYESILFLDMCGVCLLGSTNSGGLQKISSAMRLVHQIITPTTKMQ